MKTLYAAAAALAIASPAFADNHGKAEETPAEAVPATQTAEPAATTPEMTAAPAADTAMPDDAAMAGDMKGATMLGSWLMDRDIYTTSQPSTTEWVDTDAGEIPAEWEQIANIDDILVNADGTVAGYTADIGGFLGIGAKRVMLDSEALHLVHFGDDEAVFATNYSKEELEAMPEFDEDAHVAH